MSREPVVISASRRTDLAACFPEVLFSRLQEFSRETVHSVVIWTKNPRNLMAPGPLRELLKEHGQIYVHLTITGMGGSEFEPHVPPWQEVAAMAGPLIALIGGPQRLCWRFDPILEVRGGGRSFSNFSLFPSLAETLALWGIQDCRVSWVSPYKKVGRRLRAAGWELSAAPESRKAQGEILARTARD
ncbi:MAG: DUF1848 family protein, partial [Deltaproteobacteria bacterium]|nr:DUF1848 family protein [Deltaproteobacteria bacterium]